MDFGTKRTEKRIRISVLHLTVFLFVFFFNILLFSAFRSYFFLICMVVLTLFSALSFSMAWLLAEDTEATVTAEKETLRQGEKTDVIFTVTNRGFFCALRGAWFLTAGNSFYQSFDDEKLLLSLPPRSQKRLKMTVVLTDLGQVVFTCNRFFITDLLGIFEIHADCAADCMIFVLPRLEESAQKQLPDAYAGTAQLSESTKKGNDYSEVSDIRTYAPGDRPRDIHWKLSARHMELMVKERISLSGSEHILLLDLPDERRSAEQLLKEGYQIIHALITGHRTVRLLVWNAPLSAFENYSCADEEELEKAFCEIFRTDLLSHCSDMLRQYMKNCYPQSDSYLCVTKKEETVQLEICING